MPKSKIRTKSAYAGANGHRTPVKAKGPSNPAYITVMLGCLLAGLVWAVTYYLAGSKISWMTGMGAYNFLIAFALAVVGLLMTMRWR
jgi:hypothetical protein